MKNNPRKKSSFWALKEERKNSKMRNMIPTILDGTRSKFSRKKYAIIHLQIWREIYFQFGKKLNK